MAICPMVTCQKSMQIIALLSFLIFIPSLGYAQSLSEMALQLDEENLEKIKQVSAIEKQPDFSKLDCPEGTYHGLDNQGNDACRDILTNQIVDPETWIITDSGNEMITDSSRGEIILNDDQIDYVRIGILGLIGIIAAVIGVSRKKIVSVIAQRRGWNKIQKEQVRTSQSKQQVIIKCKHCDSKVVKAKTPSGTTLYYCSNEFCNFSGKIVSQIIKTTKGRKRRLAPRYGKN